MLTVRRSEDRGHADHGWLNAYHSFSFADYYDPQHLSFGSLRVINEDRVQPGRGFGQHGHRDMEIITYILDGALEHKDSMGNGSVIRPGDVQRMSAGSGVMHSEYNHSQSEMVHLLQIWITPRITGMRPGYEEKHFDAADKRGKLRLIAAPDGRDGAVTIHQDAFVYASLLDPGDALDHTLAAGRKAYVHVARGTVHVNGETLKAGDGAKIAGESRISFTGAKDAEVLLFDMA
jgi:redox-sensitive bicupin YhaK (pirin superfamily)